MSRGSGGRNGQGELHRMCALQPEVLLEILSRVVFIIFFKILLLPHYLHDIDVMGCHATIHMVLFVMEITVNVSLFALQMIFEFLC